MHASELADAVIIIIGVVTAYTFRCKACMSPIMSHRRLEVSILMSLLSRDWTKTQHIRGASVSISAGRVSVWHPILFPLQLKLQSRPRNNAGSSQNRLLCSTIERKLEISTVLHINLPHNTASQQPSGHRAIWRYLQSNRGVPLCKPPFASHQTIRFPNSATRTTIPCRDVIRVVQPRFIKRKMWILQFDTLHSDKSSRNADKRTG